MSNEDNTHNEVADRLEQYIDYGNAPGLNDLLKEAAELLRASQSQTEDAKDDSLVAEETYTYN